MQRRKGLAVEGESAEETGCVVPAEHHGLRGHIVNNMRNAAVLLLELDELSFIVYRLV